MAEWGGGCGDGGAGTAVPPAPTFPAPAEEMQELTTAPSHPSPALSLPLLATERKVTCGGVVIFAGCASMAPVPQLLEYTSVILAIDIAAAALSIGKPAVCRASLTSSPLHCECSTMTADEDFCWRRVVSSASAFTRNSTLLLKASQRGAVCGSVESASGASSIIRRFARSTEVGGGDGGGTINGVSSGVDSGEKLSRSSGDGTTATVRHGSSV